MEKKIVLQAHFSTYTLASSNSRTKKCVNIFLADQRKILLQPCLALDMRKQVLRSLANRSFFRSIADAIIET